MVRIRNISSTLEEIIRVLQTTLFISPLNETRRDSYVTLRERVVVGGGEEIHTAVYAYQSSVNEQSNPIGMLRIRRKPHMMTYMLMTRMDTPLPFYQRLEETLSLLGLYSTIDQTPRRQGASWRIEGRIQTLYAYDHRILECEEDQRKREYAMHVHPGMYTRLREGEEVILRLYRSLGLLVSSREGWNVFNIPFRSEAEPFLTSKKLALTLNFRSAETSIFFFLPPSYVQQAEEEIRTRGLYAGLIPGTIAEIPRLGLFRWLTRGEETQFPFTLHVREEPDLHSLSLIIQSSDFTYLPCPLKQVVEKTLHTRK